MRLHLGNLVGVLIAVIKTLFPAEVLIAVVDIYVRVAKDLLEIRFTALLMALRELISFFIIQK